MKFTVRDLLETSGAEKVLSEIGTLERLRELNEPGPKVCLSRVSDLACS